MKTFAPQLFASPLRDLPARTSGGMEVAHRLVKAGEKLPIIGTRQAFTRGISPVSAVLPRDLRIHELREKQGGIWMTDLPEELQQIAEMLFQAEPRGHCLVGGLGLGILMAILLQRDAVQSVTTIEINPDVIKLCWHYEDDPKARIVKQDIKMFLHSADRCFDFYFLDTWQSQGEACWWSEVLPTRRCIRNRFGSRPRIWCWAEDIMLGQIKRSIEGFEFWKKNAQKLGKKAPDSRHWYYKFLPEKMSPRDIVHFLTKVGLPTWEHRWGKIVDQSVADVSQSLEAR